MREDVKEALEYLESGGLDEVGMLTQSALHAGAAKVQLDTPMALAMLILAERGRLERMKTRHFDNPRPHRSPRP